MKWFIIFFIIILSGIIFVWSYNTVQDNKSWIIFQYETPWSGVDLIIQGFIKQAQLILSAIFAIVCSMIAAIILVIGWKYRKAFE
jgi:hypothetical protein